MSVKIYIETTISIKDPISIHAGNNNSNIMLRKIQHMYEGKCALGYKIIKILELISMGPVMIDYINNLTGGNVEVKFLAECIARRPGDILVGCQVGMAKEGILTGNHGQDDAFVIHNDLRASAVKSGDLIILTVVSAVHPAGSARICVGGNLYAHPEYNIVYECTGEFCANDQTTLLLNQVTALREEILTLDAERVDFFKKLFYAWKETKSDPTGSKKVSLSSLAKGDKKVPKYLCLDSRLGFFGDEIYGYENQTFPGDYLPVEIGESMTVIDQLLIKQLSYLNMLKEAVQIYDADKITQSANLWRLINNTKL